MGRAMIFLAASAAAAWHAVAVPLSAQDEVGEYEVRGVVSDSLGTGLQNAMVVALTRPDSVLARYALSSDDGSFVITGLAAGEYILQVTLIGYRTLRRDLDVADADVDAGDVTLSITALEMDSLVVSVEHVPFVNRRDTLRYNALAFPTPPNATVEELLRRLPGIQVESDGTITAQGEEVQNVLVEGREFFGRDPTVATRNLPADAVAQVDVYDKQSDMAEFTGIPDGDEERTIDLKLKEEARSGYFGRASGGVGGDVNNQGRLAAPVGNEARYDGSLSLNRFSPGTQLALTASANNVNLAGFSWRDFADFAGGGRGGGADDGFTETMSLGVNGSLDFGGDDSWLRGSYFVSRLDNLQDRTLQQQALFGSDIAALVDQTSSQETGNRRHRLNLNGQITFSEGHDLRLRMDGNALTSSLTSFANRKTHGLDGGMLNSAATDHFVDGDDLGGDARLTWRKRLSEDGRSLVAQLRSGLQDSDRFSDLSSVVTGQTRGKQEQHGRDGDFDDGDFDEVLQEQSRTGRTWSSSARLSLTQPLADGHTLEVFGQRNSTREDRDHSVYDLVDGLPVFNDRLSSGFERAYTYLLGGARYSRSNARSWFTAGLRLQRSQLDGVILDRDQTIDNGYTHLLASAQFKKEVKEGQNLEIRYNGSSREPSLTQLQPYSDNTDVLNIYTGNPDLLPEYVHRVNTGYRFFDQFSFVNFFTFAGFTYSRNTISQSRFFDERGFQTRMPVNAGGEWSGDLGANFGTPVRKLGIDLDLEYQVSYSEGTELVNFAANDSRILRNTFEVGVDNRVKDRFDVEVSARFSFNNVEYSLNRELNRNYVNSQYRAEGTWYLGGDWTLETDFRYRTYDQGLFSESRNIARWDAAVSRRVLDDRAEIELQAHDLLNQNQGVVVTNSANFIQDSRTESLGQYFMLSVMYRLGTRMGGRGGRRGRGR